MGTNKASSKREKNFFHQMKSFPLTDSQLLLHYESGLNSRDHVPLSALAALTNRSRSKKTVNCYRLFRQIVGKAENPEISCKRQFTLHAHFKPQCNFVKQSSTAISRIPELWTHHVNGSPSSTSTYSRLPFAHASAIDNVG